MAEGKDTPEAKAADEGRGISRRIFAWSLPVGWAAFSAASAASLVATGRFLFPNVLFEPPQSFKAGFLKQICAVFKLSGKDKE